MYESAVSKEIQAVQYRYEGHMENAEKIVAVEAGAQAREALRRQTTFAGRATATCASCLTERRKLWKIGGFKSECPDIWDASTTSKNGQKH